MDMDRIYYLNILNKHYNKINHLKYMVLEQILYQWYIYKIYVIL